jgi:GH35 family endo-1,4-beta-xylanase
MWMMISTVQDAAFDFDFCLEGIEMLTELPTLVVDDPNKKFIGNISQGDDGNIPDDFGQYWNQITPEVEGKWAAMEPEQDVTDDWWANDQIYKYAKNTNTIFKAHALLWGPSGNYTGIWPEWVNDLPAAEMKAEMEEHIQEYCERYPDLPMIDVVNEAITGHAPPPTAYITALGGSNS